jgi:hypothetical protein
MEYGNPATRLDDWDLFLVDVFSSARIADFIESSYCAAFNLCLVPYQGSSQTTLSIDENIGCFSGESLR